MANLAAPHDGYRRATQRFTMVRRDLCDALPDGSLDDHELRVCLALSRHVDPWTETWTGTLASSRACGWSKSRSTLLRTLRTLMEKDGSSTTWERQPSSMSTPRMIRGGVVCSSVVPETVSSTAPTKALRCPSVSTSTVREPSATSFSRPSCTNGGADGRPDQPGQYLGPDGRGYTSGPR